MAQKQFICANFITSSLDAFTITGEEDWVIEQAVDHLMHEHGSEGSPQLREDIKASLIDVPAT